MIFFIDENRAGNSIVRDCSKLTDPALNVGIYKEGRKIQIIMNPKEFNVAKSDIKLSPLELIIIKKKKQFNKLILIAFLL